ncbi:hypothetical protein Tco_0839668 [Tanacetum coccineum]|uniref:Uncharacterized protein n=1 Tax=Tanacetum coccineum TaxID=301880 RepID=A0ABQ5AVV8_9ASTR
MLNHGTQANAAGILVISKDHIQKMNMHSTVPSSIDLPDIQDKGNLKDLSIKPKYLIAYIVGYDQKENIDKAMKKLSENLTLILFHYDGRTSEWSEFEWSKRAIHITAHKQSKWWYAKRFLHPYIMAPYDYIFIWDEDLALDDFEAEKANYVIYKLIGAGPARLAGAIQLLAFGFNCGFGRRLSITLHKVRNECQLYDPEGRPVGDEIDSKVEHNFNRLLDKVTEFRQIMGKSADISLSSVLERLRQMYTVAGMKQISEKRTKNQAKTDKTEHGMEKRKKAKVKSKPSKSKSKVKSENEEMLNGPTRTH